MLDAYEAERQPITEQVSQYAINHALAVIDQRRAVPPEIEAEGPAGDEVRDMIGRAAYDLNVQQYCCAGLNFGYYYDRSPVIAYDGETAPSYSMGSFAASLFLGHGCRTCGFRTATVAGRAWSSLHADSLESDDRCEAANECRGRVWRSACSDRY